MIQLKANVRYALLAALDLAKHRDGDSPMKLRQIAERTGVPPNYLVHILISLKKHLLVNSLRGASGGYWLMRPPETITVAQVMEAVEPRRRASEAGGSAENKVIDRLWIEAGNRARALLATVTLSDLLGEPREG